MRPEIYQVVDWDKRYESAKSKTYNCKGQLYMPSEFGLQYRKILQMENGEKIFGAWCAMIHVASRQQLPRQGYLTHDGSKDGQPMSAGDLALLTGFTEQTMQDMLTVCSSSIIGWLCIERVNYPARMSQGCHEDSARILPGYHGESAVPLSLTNPSPSPSPGPVMAPAAIELEKVAERAGVVGQDLQAYVNRFRQIRPEFSSVKEFVIHNILRSFPCETWDPAMREFERDMPNEVQPPNNPPKKFQAYLDAVERRGGKGKPSRSRRSQYDKFRVAEGIS